MKQRIISAMVGLLILGIVLAFYETAVFNFAVLALVLMAVYELFHAAGLTRYKPLFVLCILFTALVPFLQMKHLGNQFSLICTAYAFLLFLILIGYHSTLRMEQVGFAFLISVMIPFSFSTILFIHERYETSISILYLLITLGGAWLTDTGAYFVGCKFGKHKMAPTISPKKTWEGVVGGVLGCLVSYFLLALLYITVCRFFWGIQIHVNYLALGLLAPLASFSGILGDLTASVIKRQYGVKDFGSIMPGHGGVMDRFDSVLFVAPMVYLYIQSVELFTII